MAERRAKDGLGLRPYIRKGPIKRASSILKYVPTWTEDANCVGKATEIFDYQDLESPLAEGLSRRERLEMNQANHTLAEEICIECPVFFQCKDAASEDDLFYTVRAGEKPGALVKEEARFGPQARVCKRGHDVPHGGRCVECRNHARRLRRKASKAE